MIRLYLNLNKDSVMSKLEELIQKYCPDGVEYAPLGDCLSYEQPTKYLVESTKYDDSFPIPVLTAGQTFILGYTKESSGVFVASQDNPVIIFDDFTTSFHWVEFSFKVKSSAMKMLRPIDEKKALFRYLYHCMKSIMYVPGDHTRQWIGTYSQFEIPLPPLPVQEEIVRVLDTFTELQAELQAELQKRIQQYNYYRDNLLSFEGRTDVEWKKLGDCIKSLNTGLNPRQFFKLNTDDATNYYVTIREMQHNTVVFNEGTDRMNDVALRLCNNRSNLEKGDILFSGTGTIGEVAALEETPQNWNIKEGVYAIKPKHNILNHRFLMYLLQSSGIRQAYLKKAAGGTVKSVPMGEMRKLDIPVPSIDEQQKIVSILDRFDTLTNDLTTGLPAEIEKRRQQYEYYRDKLLTFKRI